MGWIFATVVLLLIVFIPVLMKIVLVLVAIIVVVVWISIEDDAKKRKAKEVEVAAQNAVWAEQQAKMEKERIFPLSDVSLSEIKLSMENIGHFSGRIHNSSSDKTLGSLALKLIISDCVNSDESNCVVIGERNVNLKIEVPKLQARDFMEGLDFHVSRPVIRGYMKIDTDIMQAIQ